MFRSQEWLDDKGYVDGKFKLVEKPTSVIIAGSGHSVREIENWDLKNHLLLGINNFWKTFPNVWNYLIYPDDYQSPPKRDDFDKRTQFIINRNFYVFIEEGYCKGEEMGLTMIFPASYWCLKWLEPHTIGYIGCDLDYTFDENGNNTVYGKIDKIDPFLETENLQGGRNLPIYFERLMQFAERDDVKLYNYSHNKNSFLPFPKIEFPGVKQYGHR